MKIISKKTIATVVAGTFIMAGAISPFIVQASPKGERGTATHQRQVSPEQMASRMAENLGLSQADITRYQAQGIDFKDLHHASFLAKVANKTLDEVIGLKTADNTWQDVTQTLGITREQMQAARQDMMVNHLAKEAAMDKQVAKNLLQQGYQPRDISMANKLAINTSKSIEAVLSMKKINNTWQDVAKALGADENIVKQDRIGMKHGFSHNKKG